RNLPLLKQHYPAANIVAVDIAPAMLHQARSRMRQGIKRFWPDKSLQYLAGDAEALPLADNSVDLLYANLALQWCDLSASFAEIQRVLKPGGLLMFTSLGPDTLQELRQSWAAVDSYPHINQFLDMHDVAEAMQQSGLHDAVLDVDRYQLGYVDAMKMMRDLKLLGARNQLPGRRKGLTGKQALKNMLAAAEQFRLKDGQLPATYEVIYGHAWGAEKQQTVAADGSVRVSLDQLKRRL
ncbi:MAG: methyltransferase domain-containing protein, partial [Methylophaga sp.]|nr:methyltransferase domain-containing protein [Methylophaga sp.]